MTNQTLHMIGNAHIDPVWLWQWQEGFQETLATFRSALDRMAEYPDFRFSASSAALYSWVERVDPDLFAEIQARVAEGRWEIVGGWWIEPDCNIPGGESFARQALYAQRYFREKFGVIARVGYAVDSFGHSGTLPKILKQSGLDFYVFMRPGPHEKGLPGRLFWWESDDGSRILAFRLPFSYTGWGQDLEAHIRRCAAEMKPPINAAMCFYGVGDHGGGPTKENIENIRHLSDDPELPALAFSTATAFFESVATRDWPLPTVHDELQHHASGCYAAHSAIKRWNRQAENTLQRAETWAAIAAHTTGLSYPQAEFGQAWQNVLFNQFHDILAGTSLAAAYDDARNLYGEAESLADRALNDAVQSLAWQMAIPHEEGVKPIAVFNPHAWNAKLPMELEIGRIDGDAVLTDEQGTPVPHQIVQSQATAWGRTRIAFVADLPPTGYRVYRLVSGVTPDVDDTPNAADTTAENDRFRLAFDPRTGTLTSLYDRHIGTQILAGPAARPVLIADPSDTWSHNVFRFAGEEKAQDETSGFQLTRLQTVAQGPVKTVIRVESDWGPSHLVQEFCLYQDLQRIDVHVSVDWHAQHTLLKLRFPVAVHGYKVTHEIPFGHIERFPSGEEEPMQRWVDISGTADNGVPYGLSLLNDGKYSVDVTRNEIGLTVLRSPVYAHHVPAELDPDTAYAYIDQGEQTFTYSLYPHPGSWEEAATVRQAAELNRPPVALIATGRPAGQLPLSDTYLAAEPDNIIVTALKQAEEGDDLILRAYESAGMATEARIQLPRWKRTIEASFGPGEIKTWRIPLDQEAPVVDTNFLEN